MRGEDLILAAAGSWTAQQAHTLERLLETAMRRRPKVRSVSIDLAHIEHIDTYGAWLIERALRSWNSRGSTTKIVGIASHSRDLFERVQATRELEPHPGHGNPFIASLEYAGRVMTEVWHDLMLLMQMTGAVIVATGRVLRRPASFRLTSMVNHLERVAWNAVPIILLITLLIGSILAQQGIFHFRQFGADIYFDPVEVLVLPRLVALVIAVPTLTFIGSMAALYGGGLVAWLYGGIEPEIFISRLKDTITMQTFEVGMLKAPFMALVIGLVACVEGLKVEGSAESLGAKTTASVVKSIFLVIVLDGAFAVFSASIGL
jgi:phospholipid/cholesterol/gamma-HCH transport system permease protein